MDLTNSKRILYSASHLSSKLTTGERRQFAGQPSGALTKLNLLRALEVTKANQTRIREQVNLLAPDMRHSIEQLLTASIGLADRPAAHLEIAQTIAHVPDTAMVAFAKLASSVAQQQSQVTLLSDLYELQMKVSPIGRLYLERLEMYPDGVEHGELVFTVPMAPGESTTISHKEWSVSSRL